jgi:hypothetical protein
MGHWPRHCERSEAIQEFWIASSLTLLAMTISTMRPLPFSAVGLC